MATNDNENDCASKDELSTSTVDETVDLDIGETVSSTGESDTTGPSVGFKGLIETPGRQVSGALFTGSNGVESNTTAPTSDSCSASDHSEQGTVATDDGSQVPSYGPASAPVATGEELGRQQCIEEPGHALELGEVNVLGIATSISFKKNYRHRREEQDVVEVPVIIDATKGRRSIELVSDDDVKLLRKGYKRLGRRYGNLTDFYRIPVHKSTIMYLASKNAIGPDAPSFTTLVQSQLDVEEWLERARAGGQSESLETKEALHANSETRTVIPLLLCAPGASLSVSNWGRTYSLADPAEIPSESLKHPVPITVNPAAIGQVGELETTVDTQRIHLRSDSEFRRFRFGPSCLLARMPPRDF
ncbi:hypothetical protein BJ508DRAFT_366553 [Ascobolus immersus RN42]|uniref:Uncharacterized protein n=1 Tax=Ascobolus immersus RN42 TaxID=1160509 RepID=A0A3N4HPV3_ASCIM|nr:hypothetical protein BJ508DRAFT_366553 [Ascobolus immersus RN42]